MYTSFFLELDSNWEFSDKKSKISTTWFPIKHWGHQALSDMRLHPRAVTAEVGFNAGLYRPPKFCASILLHEFLASTEFAISGKTAVFRISCGLQLSKK